LKSYRLLVPIILVLLFIVSVYSLYSSNLTIEKQYNEALELARNYADQEITVYAVQNYEKAINIKPSLDLYIEVSNYYKDHVSYSSAVGYFEQALTLYPKDVRTYEVMMELYVGQKDYTAAFDLYDTILRKKMSSEKIENSINDIKYTYFTNGDYDEVQAYNGGYCAVQSSGYWGYANTSGSKAISCKYESAGLFMSDMAPVVDKTGEAYYIDASGNKVYTAKFLTNIKKFGPMSEDVFSAYNGSTWGVYNKNEQTLIEGLDDITTIANGYFAAKTGNKWYVYKSDGTKAWDTGYTSVAQDDKGVIYRNDRMFVNTGFSYIMVDSTGKQIGSTSYEDVRIFGDTTYAAVEVNGKWGFVDKDGNMVIDAKYDGARSFSNGLAAVKISGKWGFIDINGDVVIEADYYDAKDFSSTGSVFVSKGTNWVLLRLYEYNH
jgi:tetratricopeptide (TPR) repeat protein